MEWRLELCLQQRCHFSEGMHVTDKVTVTQTGTGKKMGRVKTERLGKESDSLFPDVAFWF